MWILASLYAVILVLELYALSVDDDALFQSVAVVAIALTGVAAWSTVVARRRGWA
ncbi:hypothetical protein HSB1_19860 [Halogranum salarium B-1]|uniref:Uncharacterized protein n=2 Tax=Halogranum rubrum TaxID=553466 RepID=J3A387_9EURY|nr:hypothetical protein HSB1_19860 [Halogranum salarium B-1]